MRLLLSTSALNRPALKLNHTVNIALHKHLNNSLEIRFQRFTPCIRFFSGEISPSDAGKRHTKKRSPHRKPTNETTQSRPQSKRISEFPQSLFPDGKKRELTDKEIKSLKDIWSACEEARMVINDTVAQLTSDIYYLKLAKEKAIDKGSLSLCIY